jgi:hypothetical protein
MFLGINAASYFFPLGAVMVNHFRYRRSFEACQRQNKVQIDDQIGQPAADVVPQRSSDKTALSPATLIVGLASFFVDDT